MKGTTIGLFLGLTLIGVANKATSKPTIHRFHNGETRVMIEFSASEDGKPSHGKLFLDHPNLRSMDVVVEGQVVMTLFNPNHPDAPKSRFNGVAATMRGVTSRGDGASIIMRVGSGRHDLQLSGSTHVVKGGPMVIEEDEPKALTGPSEPLRLRLSRPDEDTSSPTTE